MRSGSLPKRLVMFSETTRGREEGRKEQNKKGEKWVSECEKIGLAASVATVAPLFIV